ncbi:PAS domain-containing protein [Patescibacteria group bacterium]|nr:PAS domain-containing protein [Patescibacteria group bacterium]
MSVILFIGHNIFTIIWVIITMLITSLIAFVTVFKLEEEVNARIKAEKKVKLGLIAVKRANVQIEKEREKLRAVLSSMGEGLIVCNGKGKIELVNQAAGGLLRLVPEEALGKNFADLMNFYYDKPTPKSELPLQLIKKVIEHPDIITISPSDRLWAKNSNGHAFPVIMVIAPLIQKGGNMAIILVRDGTKEVNIDTAKSEFVSLASHQLRTPLSTMAWYAEMMLDGDTGKINKSQREFLHEIKESNRRMVELVNALLDTSRIDTGTFSITPQPTKIVEVANSVIKELEPKIAIKKINFTTKIAKNIPEFSADPKLVRIIFQNILSNAIKYTPENGKASLKIELVKKGKGKINRKKDNILITVKDSGFGIPKDEQNKIFTKLFRATNIRDKVTDGNGLGLYLVKSIIDHGGGRVWFNSFEGKGTEFFVELPLSGMKERKGTKTLG